jgi:hypothetical protein
MSGNSENRKRVFADVISVDAWHPSFENETRKADLCADVVFGIARVGGEEESPVRFRLSIKRAEVVIVIPETEPVRVEKSSVVRSAPPVPQGTVKSRSAVDVKARGKIGSSLAASSAGINASASTEFGAESGVEATHVVESENALLQMIVTSSTTVEGYYRWAIESANGKPLLGRPWDSNEPRLRLVDQRRGSKDALAPIVRLEVRCRREDLVITDLELKDGSLWASIKRQAGFKNKMAAAESYIRDRLTKEGLEVRHFSDKFGVLTLGNVIAEESN